MPPAQLLPYSPANRGIRQSLGATMQTVVKSYRGLSYLVGLNTDWLFVMATIAAALTVGAVLGMQALPLP